MTTNPFANGIRPNWNDIPMHEAERAARAAGAGGAGPQAHLAVLFDAAAKTASPAGKAMLGWMMEQLRAEAAERDKALRHETAQVIARTVKPLEARCATLERQLAVERDKAARAIETALGGFLDEPGDEDGDRSPSLDQLDRMAAQHRKDVAAFKSRRTSDGK